MFSHEPGCQGLRCVLKTPLVYKKGAMPDCYTLVMKTTRNIAQGDTLPAPILYSITGMNQIHRIWRWHRLGKVYSNPDNFLMLLAGHSLNFAFGSSLFLRLSAVCVLFATRILECVEQQYNVKRAWVNLKNAYCGHYPPPIKLNPERSLAFPFLSPSTVVWWQLKLISISDRIHRLALCTFRLFRESFILSMRTADAVETLSLNSNIQYEGVNLLFVNSSKWVERLVNDKKMLIDGLKSNRKTIDTLFSQMHAPLRSEHLVKGVAAALDKTAQLQSAAEKVNRGVGSFMKACAKNWGYGFLYKLGLHSIVPRSLVPSPCFEWGGQTRQTPSERYIPHERITMPAVQNKVSQVV